MRSAEFAANTLAGIKNISMHKVNNAEMIFFALFFNWISPFLWIYYTDFVICQYYT
jgi:hypothetical protein